MSKAVSLVGQVFGSLTVTDIERYDQYYTMFPSPVYLEDELSA